MQTTHTPGPWYASLDGLNADGGIRQARTNKIVASGIEVGLEEGIANARLIAAAPDLLAALELAIPMIDRYAAGSATVLDTMRSAIAAARGEG